MDMRMFPIIKPMNSSIRPVPVNNNNPLVRHIQPVRSLMCVRNAIYIHTVAKVCFSQSICSVSFYIILFLCYPLSSNTTTTIYFIHMSIGTEKFDISFVCH